MRVTTHFIDRQAQRNILPYEIELAFKIGEIHGDKHVTNRKLLKTHLAELKLRQSSLQRLKKRFGHLRVIRLINKAIAIVKDQCKKTLKALEKGGIVVVCAGNTLITTYRTNSFKRCWSSR